MDRTRSKSWEEDKRGEGGEREGRRTVSGGKTALLMMKQGRAGVRVHRTFSTSMRRAHTQVRIGRELEGECGPLPLRRGVTANTNDKGLWDNMQPQLSD